MRQRVTRKIAFALALLLGACGKRGDPLPPLPRTPQAVAGFTVAQRAGELEVAMVAPRLTTGGQTLGVLDLELLRVDGPGDVEKGRRQRFRAAPGERIVETFPLPPPGTPVKMAARAVHRGQASVIGKTVVLTVQPPPPPPPSLTAQLRPAGVLLTWTMPALPSPPPAPSPAAGAAPGAGSSPAPPGAPPAAAATPAASTPPPAPVPGPSPVAAAPSPAASQSAAAPAPAPTPPPPPRVRLYRRAPEGQWALLVPDALAGTTFEDTAVPQGQTWCYAARLVTAPDPMVESADSPEACLEVKDVFPPAAPTGLTALLQGEEVEVSWSPSPEADLKGYRLFRASDGAAAQPVAEVPAGTTTVRDAPAAGSLHVYRLTAVDQQGNESAPSAAAEVRRP